MNEGHARNFGTHVQQSADIAGEPSLKEPHISTKERYISAKEPYNPQQSPAFPQDSPV